MTVTSKYFTEEEFQACNPPCSLQDMEQETMNKLDDAREIHGKPMYLTCGYRSPEWDRARGRSGTGSHTLGRAPDIKCTNSRDRFSIVSALIKAGFRRIGVADEFIHADDSPNHDQDVMWTY